MEDYRLKFVHFLCLVWDKKPGDCWENLRISERQCKAGNLGTSIQFYTFPGHSARQETWGLLGKSKHFLEAEPSGPIGVIFETLCNSLE